MINTNVGDMPIEIFGDYVSDTLGEEWSWEYLVFSPCDGGQNLTFWHDEATGKGFYYNNEGFGYVYNYSDTDNEGIAEGMGGTEDDNEVSGYHRGNLTMGDGNGHPKSPL